MSPVQYVSADRLESLKAELHQLKTVERRDVADRIEVAKALGDLSENAEYHEAKDAMILLETRIFELEEFLKNVRVIDEKATTDGVARVGSTIKVEVNGKEKTFHIVGSNEADPTNGKISNESPIGSALLGSRAGDKVPVTTPAGTSMYYIKAIS
jgi:transcription elongation factor GreA